MASPLADISFDEEDRLVFQVNDPRLRADALRYSLLPKMTVVFREAILKIKEVYGISALDDSTIFRSPNFRTQRLGALRVDYNSATIGFGGKRQKNKWVGVSRRDGKEVQIIPFLFLFDLTRYGLSLWYNFHWLKGLSRESYRIFFDFLLDNEPIIHRINYLSRMMPVLYSFDECAPLCTTREYYTYMRDNDKRYANFQSVYPIPYPIDEPKLAGAIRRYISFFIVYDSFLQLAMGKQPRLNELAAKLNCWMTEVFKKMASKKIETKMLGNSVELDTKEVFIGKEPTVRPSFRWQVFTRDNWRCVVCGRSGTEGVILHVDHIVPRSKGGKNSLDNYQTLCGECNIGKGNRDATDLRAGARA